MKQDHRVTDKAKLAEAMRKQDRRQSQVARAAGCSKQFVSQLVTGTRSSCTEGVAVAIERFLQVPAGSLFVPAVEPVERKSEPDKRKSKAVAA